MYIRNTEKKPAYLIVIFIYILNKVTFYFTTIGLILFSNLIIKVMFSSIPKIILIFIHFTNLVKIPLIEFCF